MKLDQTFYMRQDVEETAKSLLGKFLVTEFDGQYTAGMIVETEAYAGVTDRASHAYNHRKTKRTEMMYHEGGTAYVYLIYGIYSLFNIVTNRFGVPHAVLIRALQPIDGINIMLQRRKKSKPDRSISGGPGLLTIALGINTSHSGMSLLDGNIWVEDREINIDNDDIIAAPRVGVGYAGEDAKLHRRFMIRDNPWVSRSK